MTASIADVVKQQHPYVAKLQAALPHCYFIESVSDGWKGTITKRTVAWDILRCGLGYKMPLTSIMTLVEVFKITTEPQTIPIQFSKGKSLT